MNGNTQFFFPTNGFSEMIQGPPKLKGPGPKNPRIKGAAENGVLLLGFTFLKKAKNKLRFVREN